MYRCMRASTCVNTIGLQVVSGQMSLEKQDHPDKYIETRWGTHSLHRYTCMHMYTYTDTDACGRSDANMYPHTQAHKHALICKCTRLRTHIHTYTDPYLNTYIHTYMCVCWLHRAHVFRLIAVLLPLKKRRQGLTAPQAAPLRICTYICTYVQGPGTPSTRSCLGF